MRVEGGCQILRVHAGAIVGDRNELAASVLDGYCDLRRSRVDAVLHQLLDDARRALDHLARSDQVHHVAIKEDYSTHDSDTAPVLSWCVLRKSNRDPGIFIRLREEHSMILLRPEPDTGPSKRNTGLR